MPTVGAHIALEGVALSPRTGGFFFLSNKGINWKTVNADESWSDVMPGSFCM